MLCYYLGSQQKRHASKSIPDLLAIAKLLIRSTIRLLPHPSQALSLLDKAAAAAEASVLREQVKQLEALEQCVETVKTVAATCWQHSLRSSRRGSESLMGLMPESSVSPFVLAATLPKNSEGRRLAASMNQSIHEVS